MKRPKSTFIFGLLFAMVVGLGGIFIPSLNQTVGAFAATADETSIFTFTATSENECSVRLTDKTVDRAIVPTTAIINNIEYDVTAIAANGFANSKNLEKVWLPSSIKTIGASIVKASAGFQGNLIALSEGVTLIAFGVVTAIDNTDLKISFKHPKELLNDNVLNVFKYTNLLGKKFDAVQGLKTIIEYAFINTTDELKKLPLTIATLGSAPNGIWTDDGNTIDLLSFIDTMFDRYNIYLDFDIDFNNHKLLCKIVKNTTEGYMIKDNIKLSKPEIDNAELPKENKAVFFNKTTGTVVNTYYLLQDNSVTQNSSNLNRLSPTVTKYIEWDEAEAIKEGYTMKDLATSELGGNIYNHCILYKLAKRQTMVKSTNFRYGDKVKIIYNGREYDSVFTGLKFKMNEPFYTCIFGKTRIDFTDRMKMYNNHKFEKRRS